MLLLRTNNGALGARPSIKGSAPALPPVRGALVVSRAAESPQAAGGPRFIQHKGEAKTFYKSVLLVIDDAV